MEVLAILWLLAMVLAFTGGIAVGCCCCRRSSIGVPIASAPLPVVGGAVAGESSKSEEEDIDVCRSELPSFVICAPKSGKKYHISSGCKGLINADAPKIYRPCELCCKKLK